MSQRIVIFGYGPVGASAAGYLVRAGYDVLVAQRRAPADLVAGARFAPCDVLDAGAVRAMTAGAAQVVLAVGFAYEGRVWRDAWPRAMGNVLAACAETAARLVFVDNLYMYGPQTEPLREDMALADYGVKPAIRAAITRQWQAEAAAGRVKVAALRAPDFYGPGVGQSHLGDTGFARIAAGKPAFLIAPPDTPHDFAYVPDFGRAVATLIAAPDDAFNQAWHVPCAPIRTPREILTLGAAALDRPAKVASLPLWSLGPMGLVMAFLTEMAEMRFQWDRPYHVDARRFARRFWSDATPFEVGAPATALAFAAAAGTRAR
jgi:nucleoside-diphosphate-sugar epimerase